MSVFESLQREYVRAVSAGELTRFCQSLEDHLDRAPQSFYHWVILARAREWQGNLDGAEACYRQALQLSNPKFQGTTKLLQEVGRFATRHQRAPLVGVKDATSVGQAPLTDASDKVPPDQSGPQTVGQGHLGPTVSDHAPSFRGTVRAEHVKRELPEVQRACEAGDRRPELFLRFGRLLQQNGQLERAVAVLDEGLSLHRGPSGLPLLNARTQVLSALGRWADAAEGYEALAQRETRPGARRFYRMQLALMHRRDGKLDAARAVLDRMLDDDPQDLIVSRMRRSLDQPDAGLCEFDTAENDTDKEAISSSPYVSPLLTCDLGKVEFRDAEILRKGGKPDLEDALRLMSRASSLKKPTPFGERYPMFQEAAKAFTRLPPGTCDPIDFLQAVTRYAYLKGSSLVLDFLGKLADGVDRETLRRLRDSITSYSLETVDVLLQIEAGQRRGRWLRGRRPIVPQAGFVFRSLANDLWTRLAFAHAIGQLSALPKNDLRFLQLFEFCLAQPQPELHRLAYEPIVACGALSRRFLSFLHRVPDGRRVIQLLGTEVPQQQHRRGVLEEFAGRSTRDASVEDLLECAIDLWAKERRKIDEFFSGLERTKLGPSTFVQVERRWREFPRQRRPLLSTDLQLADGVHAALAILSGYDKSSGEERSMMLPRFRAELEKILTLIEESPTYWGRVRFEPLLRRWRNALTSLEMARLGELRPELEVALEPPVFREQGNEVVGSVIVRNAGRATADGFAVNFHMYEPGNPLPLWRGELILGSDLPVGMSRQVDCRVPRHAFRAGLDSPYTLDAVVQLPGNSDTGDEGHETFTLEIDRGGGFARDAVPWNEVPIPKKDLFKGRQRELDELERHLRSPERDHTPLLVGLTRTGKSTLLTYLKDRLHLKPSGHIGEPTQFLCVCWDFADAAGRTEQRNLWKYLLWEQLVVKLKGMVQAGELPDTLTLPPIAETEVGPQDWRPLLLSIRSANLYPVVLVDEFTYYRSLADNKLVGPAFLAAMRSFAIEGLASFVFAGTYELRDMVRDPAYGITGQLVNVVERRVSSIDEPSARELIGAMEPRLRFTDEATTYIFRLSFRIPYFIQLICKNAAWVAAATSRGWVGYPDLERVVRVLAGESEPELPGGVQQLSGNAFDRNMYFASDPQAYHALLSTMCSLSCNRQQPDIPRPVLHEAIVNEWTRHAVPAAERMVAEAVGELKERQVLVDRDEEGQPSYTISVDLFRRWWGAHHRFLKPELDLLK